jgi:hypothetical protein
MTDPYDAVIGVFTAVCRRYEQVGFLNLSDPEKAIFCTWQFVSDVNNGGFRQYLVNPAGEFAAETASALEAIGMPRAAALLRRALAAFPDHSVPTDNDARVRAIRALPRDRDRQFDALTEEFYASPEDPYALQWDYIVRYRGELPEPSGR